MKIAIIEDELLTAEDLAYILANADLNISVQAILTSVQDAIAWFQQQPAVDLVFSDIQLGDGLSFEIFKAVRIPAPVVFCTAYDEYALEAIRSNGIEYILKPFTAETVLGAIDKFQQLKKHFIPATVDYEKLIRLITDHESPRQEVSSVLVYHRDKILPVPLTEIALFFVEGEITRLHCFNGKSYIVNQPLDELEKLSKGVFFRVNRQYLVNRRSVTDANYYQPRKYVVNLSIAFKEAIVVSKNRTAAFLQWLTQK
jgi:DNA-binding LytR/AlgR family response regulator